MAHVAYGTLFSVARENFRGYVQTPTRSLLYLRQLGFRPPSGIGIVVDAVSDVVGLAPQAAEHGAGSMEIKVEGRSFFYKKYKFYNLPLN